MADEGGGRAKIGATIVAVLAAAGSLLSAGLSWDQNRRATKLQSEINAAEASYRDAVRSQQQEANDRDYQLKVAERVAAALEKIHGDAAQVNIASALVFTLPEGGSDESKELKRKLAVIVVNRALEASARGVELDPTVSDLRRLIPARDEGEPEPPAAQAQTEAAAPPSVRAQPAAAQTRELVASPNPKGWDVDVFWCEGANGPQNAEHAQKMGELLAMAAKTQTPLGATQVGRVRVRMLRADVNARPGYQVARDEIRPEASETAAAGAIAAYLNQRGAGALDQAAATNLTPWYLSIFACSGKG